MRERERSSADEALTIPARKPAPAASALLRMQSRAGNRGVRAVLARYSTGRNTPQFPITQQEIDDAKQANDSRFSVKSIRTIQALLGRRGSGSFDDAEIRDLDAMRRTSPRGVIDEPLLDMLVRKAAKNPDMLAHALYLADDFYLLGVAQTALTVRYDPRLRKPAERTPEGRSSIITFGPQALANGLASLRAAIEAIPDAPLTRSSKAPSHLKAAEAEKAAENNRVLFGDFRSPDAIKDGVGAKTNDGLGTETAQWIADFQKRRGLTPTGVVDEGTLRPIVSKLVKDKRHNSAIRLIADFFGLDQGHALDADYADWRSAPFTLEYGAGDAPARISFGEDLFKHGFEGAVHAIAEAFAQAQGHAAWLSPAYQHFWAKARELTLTLPDESMAAFGADVRELLARFDNLNDEERERGVHRLKEVRELVIKRGSAANRRETALEDQLTKAIDAVRP